MTEPHRQTGKTFRKMMEALQICSSGYEVIYQCTSMESSKWHRDKCMDICVAYFGEEQLKLASMRVVLPNNCTIKFTSRIDPQTRYLIESGQIKVVSDVHGSVKPFGV